jgi:hypothetical protein
LPAWDRRFLSSNSDRPSRCSEPLRLPDGRSSFFRSPSCAGDRHGVRPGAEVCSGPSPLFPVLQPGQVDGARFVASGHCGCFRYVNRTGIFYLFDNTLTVELPHVFAAAATYTDRETAVGVHIDTVRSWPKTRIPRRAPVQQVELKTERFERAYRLLLACAFFRLESEQNSSLLWGDPNRVGRRCRNPPRWYRPDLKRISCSTVALKAGHLWSPARER